MKRKFKFKPKRLRVGKSETELKLLPGRKITWTKAAKIRSGRAYKAPPKG